MLPGGDGAVSQIHPSPALQPSTMIPVYGDREPEQQSHSQLLPHPLISEEPERQARRLWFKRPNVAW